MRLIPTRKASKKQKAMKAAGKASKKVAKAKAVQKAPKTAAAVWTGRRSGKLLKGAAMAVVGVVTLKAIRRRMHAGEEPGPAASESYRSTPTPSSSQQSGVTNGSAPAQTETPVAPPLGASATPPHGDKLTGEGATASETDAEKRPPS